MVHRDEQAPPMKSAPLIQDFMGGKAASASAALLPVLLGYGARPLGLPSVEVLLLVPLTLLGAGLPGS